MFWQYPGGKRMDMQAQNGDYLVSDAPDRLDIDAIHRFLGQAYWARGIERPTLERAIRHSLCLGLYAPDAQIGFARVVTDRTTFAYLMDVYVLESYRGRGLGRWLMECVLHHPELQIVRRWLLATRDAADFYARFGFSPVGHPERLFEWRPERTYDRKSAGPE